MNFIGGWLLNFRKYIFKKLNFIVDITKFMLYNKKWSDCAVINKI